MSTMLLSAAGLLLLGGATADSRPWMDKADPPGVRAKALLAKMSLAEKIVMLHGPAAPMPCCECHNKTTGKIISPLCAYTGERPRDDSCDLPS